MPTKYREENCDFLHDSGVMGARIMHHDWSSTELGHPRTWQQSLRVAVQIMLKSSLPMFLWWGPSRLHLYNDAFLDLMKRANARDLLGATAQQRSTDPNWRAISPAIASAAAGLRQSALHQPLMQGRDQVRWDYEMLPIDGTDGVDGVIAIIRNTSCESSEDEQLALGTTRFLSVFERPPAFICLLKGQAHEYSFINHEYRQLMGSRRYLGRPVRDVLPELHGQGCFEFLDRSYKSGEAHIWKGLPLRMVPDEGAGFKYLKIDVLSQPLTFSDGRVFGIFIGGVQLVGNDNATPRTVQRPLTIREREVLSWIALGKTAGETATILDISKRTCEMHVYAAARKLDASNSTQTVVEAIRRGELPL